MSVDPKKHVEYIIRGEALKTSMCVPVDNGTHLLCAAWRDETQRTAYWGVFDRETGFPIAMLGGHQPSIMYNSQVIVRNVEKEQLSPKLQAMADLAERKRKIPTDYQLLLMLMEQIVSYNRLDCSEFVADYTTGKIKLTGEIDVAKLAGFVQRIIVSVTSGG